VRAQRTDIYREGAPGAFDHGVVDRRQVEQPEQIGKLQGTNRCKKLFIAAVEWVICP
jgi:hypothetical protein